MATIKALVGAGVFINEAKAVLGNTVETGVTADTGSVQGDSYPITRDVTVVATVGTAGDSLILPKAETGDEYWVRNGSGTSMDVFPQVGGAINGGSTDAAVAVAAGKTAIFKAISSLDWVVAISA